MANTVKTLKMNDTRRKVIDVLKNADAPMTLNDIAKVLNVDVKTGTTNALIAAGVLKVAGTVKVPVTTYREVNTYALGDVDLDKLVNTGE